MIVLDANVLIALLDTQDALHGRALELVDHHEWDEFCTSSLTLAETLVRSAARGTLARERTAISNVGVHVLPVSDAHVRDIATLRAGRNVRLPDAVVLTTAMRAQAPLATFDKRLARLADSVGASVADEPDPESDASVE